MKLDHGACGFSRVKPTTLLADLKAMKELDRMKADGAKEEMEVGLGPRMRQTSTWSAWVPGLARAIQPEAVETACVTEPHHPLRRGCHLCIEEMGQDLAHRRRPLTMNRCTSWRRMWQDLSSKVLTLGGAKKLKVCADSDGVNPAGDCQKGGSWWSRRRPTTAHSTWCLRLTSAVVDINDGDIEEGGQ